MSVSKYRILLIFYCIVILSLSSIPGTSLPKIEIKGWDKIVHFIEYAGLGWLLVQSLERKELKLVVWVIMGGLLFGVFDESVQYFVPRRIASIYDWFADSIGVTIGAYIASPRNFFRSS